MLALSLYVHFPSEDTGRPHGSEPAILRQTA
jgi:hypothetical protein